MKTENMTWIQQINSLPYGTYNLWGREADVSEIKHLTNKIILDSDTFYKNNIYIFKNSKMA